MNLDEAVACVQRRWPTAVSSSQEAPVFVLATGWRSGSTLLQRMLFKHCLVWGEPFGSSGFIERMSQPLRRFSNNWPDPEFLIDSEHWGEQLGDKWTANLYPSVETLLAAHVEFFRTLLAEPSRQRGFARWGLKEVRYGIEHAHYLRWLFPRARFVFLLRNPYECWSSYRRAGSRVQRFWPEDLIDTPEKFGQHWLNLAWGFSSRFQEVDGFLLRYEALCDPLFDPKPLEKYLGFELDLQARKVIVGGSPPGNLLVQEMDRLQWVINPLASYLGYTNPFTDVNPSAQRS
jgi:hypothetical protein